MRAVTYTEFVALPNGTLFQYLDVAGTWPEPGLHVKNETIYDAGVAIDFFMTPLFLDDDVSAARPGFAPSCSRDALYDPTRKFLVLEPGDVTALVGLLGIATAPLVQCA